MIRIISAGIIKIVYFFQGIFTQKRKVCPYCGSSSLEIIATKARVIQVCYCRNCYLYWMNPIFVFPFFYDLLYREKGIAALSNFKKAKEIVRKHFYDEHIDARAIIHYLAGLSQGRKLLEIGCSWGYFLAQARECGFQCTGVEISGKRRKLAEKIFGLQTVSTVDSLIKQQATFDVIYCRQTFEHLGGHIHAIFSDMHALLADGGVIVLDVPRLHPERGKKALTVMGAVHPLGFTRDFFERNMQRHGFSVIVQNSYTEDDQDWFLVVILRKVR